MSTTPTREDLATTRSADPVEILYRAALIVTERGVGDRRTPDHACTGATCLDHGGIMPALIEAAGGWVIAPGGNRWSEPEGMADVHAALRRYARHLCNNSGAIFDLTSRAYGRAEVVRWLRATAAMLEAERDLRVALADLASLDAELDHRPEAEAGGDAWFRRTQLVWEVYHLAVTAGWQAAVDVDPEMPAYPVVVRLELPAGSIGLVDVTGGTMPAPGQISWHVVAGLRPPQHRMRWDGHTREDQAERIAAYLDGVAVAS